MNTDEATGHEDARWWRSRSILVAIAFRMMVLWLASAALIFVAAMVHEIVGDQPSNWNALWREAVVWFGVSAIWGTIVAVGFGIPLWPCRSP